MITRVIAENEGFEPPEVLPSTVFKTAAFDHSANSPVVCVWRRVYRIDLQIAIGTANSPVVCVWRRVYRIDLPITIGTANSPLQFVSSLVASA